MPRFDFKPLPERSAPAGCLNKFHDDPQLAELFDPPSEVPICMLCKRLPIGDWYLSIAWLSWFQDPESHHLQTVVHVGRDCRRMLNKPLDNFYQILRYDGKTSVVSFICKHCLGKHGKDVENVLLEAGVTVPGETIE